MNLKADEPIRFQTTDDILALLLRSLILVHISEGRDQGGYDANLQSYYDRLYSVTRNEVVFEAITAIVKHNQLLLSDAIRKLLIELGDSELQVTSSTLCGDTNYFDDTDSRRAAEEARARILEEVVSLFAAGSREQ